MATIGAEYFDDLGRVHVCVTGAVPDVEYTIQRQVTGLDWVRVRGGIDRSSDTGEFCVDDYEYVPNVENCYRLVGPTVADTFSRSIPSGSYSWGEADQGGPWTVVDDFGSSTDIYVEDGAGVVESDGLVLIELQDNLTIGNSDTVITFRQDQAVAPGDAVRYGVIARSTYPDARYEAYVRLNSDSSIDFFLRRLEGGAGGEVFSSFTDVTWSPSVALNVRIVVEDATIRLRMWTVGTEEPQFWQVEYNDTDGALPPGGMGVYTQTTGGTEYQNRVLEYVTHETPPVVDDTTCVTPSTEKTFLKSVVYPAMNLDLDCMNWDLQTRTPRNGLYNVKGRHPYVGIWDVGSTATFTLTFTTEGAKERDMVRTLLAFGGVLFLQPPGDDNTIKCNQTWEGLPTGYVLGSADSSENHALPGRDILQWAVTFTIVARPSLSDIVPTMMTWRALWNIIGPTGTWQQVWDMWDTWQQVWDHQPTPTQLTQ